MNHKIQSQHLVVLRKAEVMVLETMKGLLGRVGCNSDDNFNLNANNKLNNTDGARGIALKEDLNIFNGKIYLKTNLPCKIMKTYNNLYNELCSYDNLYLAYKNARKNKTTKPYVIKFEKDLKNNLLQLRYDLLLHSYRPLQLKTFILRDPKTRKISKSEFRDRIVHHAICKIISPMLEIKFIHDSYANQKGKGVFAAIKRFEYFKGIVSHNLAKIKKSNNIKGFVLKADIRKFFDSIDHTILLSIIKRTIKDDRIIWLIRVVLSNYKAKSDSVGMPLGNLTSQFFANVYLNDLDYFIKYELRVKYYIRYVDDFVILHKSKEQLEIYMKEIDSFLTNKLNLKLHSEKSKIFSLYKGVNFLGLKIFPNHKSIQQKNIRKFKNKLELLCQKYDESKVNYDGIYDFVEGWCAYAKNANAYGLRTVLLSNFKQKFANEISTKEINKLIKGHKLFSKVKNFSS